MAFYVPQKQVGRFAQHGKGCKQVQTSRKCSTPSYLAD